MREIKFNAFLESVNEVFPVVQITQGIGTFDSVTLDIKNSKHDFKLIDSDDHTLVFHMNGVKLLQYTGLKDKNGTEIYEGDILDVQEDTVQIVCWDEHQARYKSVPLYLYHINAGAGGWTGHNLHNRKLEVTGNIHQHPELLNN